MALHPVPDPPSADAVDGVDQSELDAMAALISTGAPPGIPATDPTEPRFVMIDRSRADTQAPARTVAGWYPDENDPGLRRYWDGHHLTGQTVRIDPEGAAATGAHGAAPLPRMVAPLRDQSDQSDRHAESSWTTLRTAFALPTVPEGPGTAELTADELTAGELTADEPTTAGMTTAELTADEPTGSGTSREPRAASTGDGTSIPPRETPDLWADKVVAAVARARAAGTPEEWRQVVSVASVVSELAGTMAVAAGAARAAEEARRAAERTRNEADAAARLAQTARKAEQEATERARRAQEAAAATTEAAAAAVEQARTAEQEAPRVATVADTAARQAAAARATLEGITTIVAGAEAADTPDAWSEAHRLAQEALSS